MSDPGTAGRPPEHAGWTDAGWFRVLDTYFSFRHNDALVGDYVDTVLGGFRVPPDPVEVRSPPTPNLPPRYSLHVSSDGQAGPPAARYRLYYGDALLIDTPTPGTTLTHLFWHVNAEAIRQTGSFFLAHAGSVQPPSGGALVMPAESGSGKTTLVAALVKAGFGYLSDEAAVVDPVSGRVHPFPKALTLKKGSFPLFPELAGAHLESVVPGTWHVRPDELRPGAAVDGVCEAGWIVPIRFDPDVDGAEVSPMRPAETAVALATYALNLHRYGARALPLLADLARRACGHRLRYGSLDAAVEALSDLTGARGGRLGTHPGRGTPVRPHHERGGIVTHDDETTAEIEVDDIDGGFVPRARPAVASVELDGEAVLFDETTGTAHLLDPVATLVWKCFDGIGTLDELVDDLADAFGAPREDVAGDVLALARQAGGNGLLEGVARARPELVAPPRPASVPEGTPVPAFDYPGVGGRVRLAEHRGSEVVLVNWSAACGFCDGMVGVLVEAVPLLAERRVHVVLISRGAEESHLKYREQGLVAPMALADDDFDVFTGVGTPAAYLLDSQGTVASPLAIGAVEVEQLVRTVAGLPDAPDRHDHDGHGHVHPHRH